MLPVKLGGVIMEHKLSINGERLLTRLKKLGELGRDEENVLARVAATDADKAGRDAVVGWMDEVGLEVAIDKIGNIFGIWSTEENQGEAPVMIGSHIDSVINAGIYDGCYGVISGIEVINTLKEESFKSDRPIVVGAFTNEEGIRYQPDMLGSLVYIDGLSLEEGLKTIGTDGTVLGDELKRIGYAGEKEPGFIKPHAYVELHVEQGPVLDKVNIPVGAVENLQGISWQKFNIKGVANHAGTTPTSMRVDAGLAAAKINTFMRDIANNSGGTTVATIGTMKFEPDVINVIPSNVTFTVDIRDPNEDKLKAAEVALEEYIEELEKTDLVEISSERLARFEPVIFDESIVELVEEASQNRGLKSRRMTSGAGHDAQMLARICPTAMIFVPSVEGISHNPKEFTEDKDLVAGTNILLDVICRLSESK